MLTSVQFKSIRSLLDVRIELGRLTVLVGPNGCGKSTVLDQIENLCLCTQPDPASGNVLEGAYKVIRSLESNASSSTGSSGPLVLGGEGGTGESYVLTVATPAQSGWYSHTQVEILDTGRRIRFEGRGVRATPFEPHFSWRAQRLRLVAAAIAAPVNVLRDQLGPDGFGLAALLANLALNDQTAYAALQDDLRSIVPQFQKLQISKVTLQGNDGTATGGYALGMVMKGAGLQSASAVSDGTLLALALLTATHNRDMPPLVLMDDVDHGLHLKAQWVMLDAIRRVLDIRPELQVVCTTHSPYLLDAVQPGEVRVLALDEQGHTAVRKLTDHPDFEQEHKGLQTGEFWATFGESWVTEGAARRG